MTWTYVVTNPGNSPITHVVVTDDHGVSTRRSTGGDTDGDGDSIRARPGPTRPPAPRRRASTPTSAAVTAPTLLEDPVPDTDPSPLLRRPHRIDIVKSTNGTDANAAPGPLVPVGDPVTWTYVVTNTGNVPLGRRRRRRRPGWASIPAFVGGDDDSTACWTRRDLDLTATGTPTRGPVRQHRHRHRHRPAGRTG